MTATAPRVPVSTQAGGALKKSATGLAIQPRVEIRQRARKVGCSLPGESCFQTQVDHCSRYYLSQTVMKTMMTRSLTRRMMTRRTPMRQTTSPGKVVNPARTMMKDQKRRSPRKKQIHLQRSDPLDSRHGLNSRWIKLLFLCRISSKRSLKPKARPNHRHLQRSPRYRYLKLASSSVLLALSSQSRRYLFLIKRRPSRLDLTSSADHRWARLEWNYRYWQRNNRSLRVY
jgi:hypothetical protein